MSLLSLNLGKRRLIIKKLKEEGAISEDTAKSLEEIVITGYNLYSDLIKKLLQDKVLIKTKDNKYYINN